MKKINLLDCTLRDGGYYNNWNFSKSFINNYLKTMKVSGKKYVELVNPQKHRGSQLRKIENVHLRDHLTVLIVGVKNAVKIVTVPLDLNITIMITQLNWRLSNL